MATGQWLSLFDYSTKHGVSLSTLRRRIKSNAVQYKLENGKYFLSDETQSVKEAKPDLPAHAPDLTEAQSLQTSTYVEASVLSSANRLVEELKTAYAKILQEKEEQISLLKEEVIDLRTLARILESQAKNQRSENKSIAKSQTYFGTEEGFREFSLD